MCSGAVRARVCNNLLPDTSVVVVVAASVVMVAVVVMALVVAMFKFVIHRSPSSASVFLWSSLLSPLFSCSSSIACLFYIPVR